MAPGAQRYSVRDNSGTLEKLLITNEVIRFNRYVHTGIRLVLATSPCVKFRSESESIWGRKNGIGTSLPFTQALTLELKLVLQNSHLLFQIVEFNAEDGLLNLD